MSLVGTTRPYFLEAGAGSTAVLMLHGVGGSHGAFTEQMAPLAAAGYRALAWDMPGYGFSRSVDPYTFDALAAACIDLIELAEAERLVLLGHSMGGMVAQQVAALRPDLVSGLVLVATSAAFGSSDGAWQREFLAERMAPLERGQSMADLAAKLVAGMVGANALPEGVAHARAIMSGVSIPTYRHALAALAGFDARAQLAAIAVPTLLVAGESDSTAPAALMQKMSQRIAASEFTVLPGIGHIVPLEAPDAFNARLLEYLKRHFPLAAAPASPS
jgi:pimeloyl-ACP methyl ester carboxylesterase